MRGTQEGVNRHAAPGCKVLRSSRIVGDQLKDRPWSNCRDSIAQFEHQLAAAEGSRIPGGPRALKNPLRSGPRSAIVKIVMNHNNNTGSKTEEHGKRGPDEKTGKGCYRR
jgi:hypothetical protein